MASSKKYGYQLRGDKLSICELDVTGTGDGLNYTYSENGGLDIATDPSAWKSPLTTITQGLQIEYLSNEFTLDNLDAVISPSTQNLVDYAHSTMSDVSWMTALTSEDYLGETLNDTLSHPTVLSSTTDWNANNYSDEASSLILKVTCIPGTTSPGDPTREITRDGGFYSIPMEFLKGYSYKVTFDMRVHSSLYAQNFHPSVSIIKDDYSELDLTYLANPVSNGYWETHEGKYDISFRHATGMERYAFLFTMPETISGRIFFTIPTMAHDHDNVYFDNITAVESATAYSTGGIDVSELTLPSYAQKALLDYVRAQESYEGGDLEKWDFFMKQFRSKLERWEDSRITGPRVLGPSSSSIR